MNVEMPTLEVVVVEQSSPFTFVVDADLARVGGGSSVLEY
jgi:hypothetical protein